jgi:hypothetical protein
MRLFLKAAVVPSASDESVKLLRRVLHGEPFKISSPDELMLCPVATGEAILGTMAAEAVKHGVPPPSPTMSSEFLGFLTSVGGAAGSQDGNTFEPDDPLSYSGVAPSGGERACVCVCLCGAGAGLVCSPQWYQVASPSSQGSVVGVGGNPLLCMALARLSIVLMLLLVVVRVYVGHRIGSVSHAS